MTKDQWFGTVQKWAVEVAMQEYGSPYMAPLLLKGG